MPSSGTVTKFLDSLPASGHRSHAVVDDRRFAQLVKGLAQDPNTVDTPTGICGSSKVWLILSPSGFSVRSMSPSTGRAPSPDGRPVVPRDLVERLRVDDEVLLSARCPN